MSLWYYVFQNFECRTLNVQLRSERVIRHGWTRIDCLIIELSYRGTRVLPSTLDIGNSIFDIFSRFTIHLFLWHFGTMSLWHYVYTIYVLGSGYTSMMMGTA